MTNKEDIVMTFGGDTRLACKNTLPTPKQIAKSVCFRKEIDWKIWARNACVRERDFETEVFDSEREQLHHAASICRELYEIQKGRKSITLHAWRRGTKTGLFILRFHGREDCAMNLNNWKIYELWCARCDKERWV